MTNQKMSQKHIYKEQLKQKATNLHPLVELRGVSYSYFLTLALSFNLAWNFAVHVVIITSAAFIWSVPALNSTSLLWTDLSFIFFWCGAMQILLYNIFENIPLIFNILIYSVRSSRLPWGLYC